MIESLILIEGQNLNEDVLAGVGLMNAKQLLVGRTPGGGVILHVAANSSADLGNAMLEFTQAEDVTEVLTLALKSQQ